MPQEKQEPGFAICMGKGFHLTFANGITLSVQFGPDNYCDNRLMDGMDWQLMCPKATKDGGYRCDNAEIAVWDAKGKWITKKVVRKALGRKLSDNVEGDLTPDDVAKLVAVCVAL